MAPTSLPPLTEITTSRSNGRRLVDRYRSDTKRTAQLFDALLVVTALILFTIAWPNIHNSHFTHPAWWPVLAAIGTFPLLTARRAPVPSLLAATLAAVVVAVIPRVDHFALAWPVPQFLALIGVVTVAIAVMPRHHLRWAVPLSICIPVLNPTTETRLGWAIGFAVLITFVLLVRWLSSSRQEVADQNIQLAHQQQRQTIAEEKARLARDLHDVVAHQMSMIVVQAQSAPYRLREVTPAIHAEFDSLAATAREALDEVRELLGVLRGDGVPETAPVGSTQIEPTLRAARAAGIDLGWTISGDAAQLDETTGVVLHRLLQECLSNAARHAPGGKVQVALDIPARDAGADTFDSSPITRLNITNGPGTPGALPSPSEFGGSGISGMAARVEAVGGTFTAIPESDGGFTVEARIPLRRR